MTKSRVQAKAVDTSKLRNFVVGSAIGLAVIFGAMSLRADEAITKTHGFNFFGELKYPADYKHLDYVNPDAPKGGEISIWTMGTFDSFNPYTRKGRAGALASAPFESLLEGTSDEVGTSYGLLAETLEYPEDQSWVIFNMRPEARFSDGTPVTADDVAFTYELFLNEGLASYRAILGQIVTGVEILGPHRVKYSFADDASRRDAIPIVGGLPVKSKAWFEKTGAKLDESRMEPAIGSGPYVLDSYDINKRITYKRNPDYWGNDLPFNKGRANFDTIRVEYFADSNAAFEGFKSGAYTFRQENSSKSWATAYDFPALDEGHVIKTLLPDGGMATGQSYVMNLRRDKFDDIRVRQAVGLLFNFEWSNESLFYGQYARINSFWENSELAAAGMPSDAELALLEPIADLLPAGVIDGEAVMAPVSGNRTLDRKNLRKASALLDEAGWTVGDDGLRRNAAGETLTIEIIEDSPTFDRVHLPFIDNLKAAGIDAIYSRIDPAQMTDRSRNYDFDMMVDQFPMSLEPSSGLKQYFGSETADQSVFNLMGLKSEAVDTLIEHVMNAQNKAELATSVKALDRTLRAYYFWVPQWFNDAYRVAYWDMYEHPETLPPFALGNLDFWWYNAEKAADLKAKGVLR
ncbi:MAG: ABC transporter substrate-binding protein [Rhodobacteraceae bacterium]|jgi:microcin C transport system substrate-binding protein|nr:ABC transporter substrate-binding protein [Paracoccaceae bacterium]